jgi:hypothetical protein
LDQNSKKWLGTWWEKRVLDSGRRVTDRVRDRCMERMREEAMNKVEGGRDSV